jgi:hypothetical protein
MDFLLHHLLLGANWIPTAVRNAFHFLEQSVDVILKIISIVVALSQIMTSLTVQICRKNI